MTMATQPWLQVIISTAMTAAHPGTQPYNGTETTPANCSSSYSVGKWDCVHRDRRVANMVGFRNYVSGTSVGNWVTGDVNQIAFSRGTKGFLAINNSSSTWQKTFTTGLADGSYCNVVASDNPETGSCAGASVYRNGRPSHIEHCAQHSSCLTHWRKSGRR